MSQILRDLTQLYDKNERKIMSSFRKIIRKLQLPETYQNIKGMNTCDEFENVLKITL